MNLILNIRQCFILEEGGIFLYKVLLVEDDSTNLLLYKSMKVWNEMGFKIKGEARNGKEALEFLEKEQVDMILVDVIMPVMNGLDFLEEMQKRDSSVISIIASTYEEFEYARKGMQFGAIDYLVKPVKKEQLKECLKKVKEKLGEKDEVEYIFHIFGVNTESVFVKKVMNYFRQPNLEISLIEISKEFSYNKDYFGKLFKEQMGENFNSFVLKYNMERAKLMLHECDYKIYEISEKLGYKSSDYFTKLFKEYEGITPSDYKMKVRG